MLMLFIVSWNQPVMDAKSVRQHQCVHRVFLIRFFIWDFWLWGFRLTKGSCQGDFFPSPLNTGLTNYRKDLGLHPKEMSKSNTFSKKITFVSVIYQKSTELLSLKSGATRECLKPSSTLWLQNLNMATAIYPMMSQGINTWFIYNWFYYILMIYTLKNNK